MLYEVITPGFFSSSRDWWLICMGDSYIMKLLKYSEIDELHYSEYIDEWEKSGELIVPAASKRGNKSFSYNFV